MGGSILKQSHMDWNGLRIFLELQRTGSARAAAERLACSHATVLRRLTTFETQIGVQLFDRTPEGLMLSVAGGNILEKAQQVESEILEMQRTVSGSDIELEGLIRLTVSPPLAEYLILPSLPAFKLEFPQIDIEIVATNDYSDLPRRDADIAIRFQEKPDDHLVGRRLPPFRDAVYATPDYIREHWSGNKAISPQWIAWSGLGGFKERTAQSPFGHFDIAWEFATLGLQVKAAELGLGMAFLPCLIGDSHDTLTRVPNSGRYDGRPAWLLTHADLRRMERVRIVSNFLYTLVQSKRAAIAGE